MLRVTVQINELILQEITVVRVKPLYRVQPHSRCSYHVFDDEGNKIGEIHNHRYGAGATVLARRMLKEFGHVGNLATVRSTSRPR